MSEKEKKKSRKKESKKEKVRKDSDAANNDRATKAHKEKRSSKSSSKSRALAVHYCTLDGEEYEINVESDTSYSYVAKKLTKKWPKAVDAATPWALFVVNRETGGGTR